MISWCIFQYQAFFPISDKNSNETLICDNSVKSHDTLAGTMADTEINKY